MPVPVRLVAGALLVLAGVALVTVAVLGARSRLRRNRWVGVRTAATLASPARFAAGNRAAAVPAGTAGAVAVAGGAVLLTGSVAALSWVVLAVSAVGTLGLAGVAGLVGDRAAADPAPLAAGCAGACAGCDLVAGCRDGGRPR